MTLLTRVVVLCCLMVGSVAVSHAALPDFRQLVKDTSPAVVNISTVQRANQSARQFHGVPDDVPDIFRHFFGVPTPSPHGQNERTSLGSGFIVSRDGYILTNNHVVKDASEIVVRLNDRRELNATLVGSDPSSDLALLKVDAKRLPTVKIGDSDRLEVGEWVVAIGSPFGFDYSVTAGIVSAIGRNLPNENYVPFIQTDVAINPGNSGGPLFNLRGEVVGINSQIYTRSGGFMGVSFAIPMSVAVDVAEQLKEKGRVSRGWLGVVIQEVSKELADSFGLDKAAGALVAQVVRDGPAEQAGLQNGDIITHFSGHEIERSADLPHRVGRVSPGTKVPLDIVRQGKRETIQVTVGALPDGDGAEVAGSRSPSHENHRNRLALVVSDLNETQRQRVGDGVWVRAVNEGPAAQAGIVRDDVITMINGATIRNVADFERIVAQLPADRNIHVRIVRRGSAMFIPLRIPQ
ncbi:MAG: DegQ family serine endoprotease [Bacterioplanes sp.]|nr:DegQ family serine endoprotease [Bacterioplanes sp.]